MTLTDRARAYAEAFPQWPQSHLHVVEERGRVVLYGWWVFGQSWKNKSALYGAYPANYLARLMALFPDAGGNILHAFSGALPPGPYSRLDLLDRCGVPDLRLHIGDVCAAPAIFAGREPFRLVAADPPYTPADADIYGTPMVNKRLALRALAAVTEPGGFVAWLDTCWPMHRRDEWETAGRLFVDEVPAEHAVDDTDDIPQLETAGRIGVVRSTNHRVRLLTLFERTAHA